MRADQRHGARLRDRAVTLAAGAGRHELRAPGRRDEAGRPAYPFITAIAPAAGHLQFRLRLRRVLAAVAPPFDPRLRRHPWRGAAPGKPTFSGTRLTVQHVLERMADDWSEAEVLQQFPVLAPEHLRAALAFAGASLGSDVP